MTKIYTLDLGVDLNVVPSLGASTYPLQLGIVDTAHSPDGSGSPAWMTHLTWGQAMAFRLWNITPESDRNPTFRIVSLTLTWTLRGKPDHLNSPYAGDLSNPLCLIDTDFHHAGTEVITSVFPDARDGQLVVGGPPPLGRLFRLDEREVKQRFGFEARLYLAHHSKLRFYDLDPEAYIGPDG